MKRTILCVSLLALSLTACKNDAKSNEEATAEERTEQTKEANTENLPLAFNSDEQYCLSSDPDLGSKSLKS